jgi:hypothetical protein
MAKITKVPNGPLIKKKGPFKGSTLKSGGTIKKAINGGTTTTQTTNPPMTRRDSLIANIKEQSRLRQNLVDFRKKVGNKRLTPELIREKDSLNGLLSDFSTKQRMKSTGLTEQQLAKNDSVYTEQERRKKSVEDDSGQLRGIGKDNQGCSGSQRASARRVRQEARRKNGGPIKKAQGGKRVTRWMTDEEYKKETDSLSKNNRKIDPGFTISPKGSRKNTDPGFMKTPSDYDPNKKRKRVTSEDGMLQYLKNGNKIKKAKAGAMIKRADGSMSRRGLWDNMRANKGSGKKPTKQMLVQEKKIKAKAKK